MPDMIQGGKRGRDSEAPGMEAPSRRETPSSTLRIVVVTKGGQSIDVDVDAEATITDVRAAAASRVQRPLRPLTCDGLFLPDDSELPPGQRTVHEMQSSGWFVRRKAWLGYTPIYLATAGGHNACLQSLLRRCPQGGFDMDNHHWWTPFSYAIAKDYSDCLESLLEYHPQMLMQREELNGTTLFHDAATKGSNACLKVLLQRCPYGAMVRDHNGATPVDNAEKAGHRMCLELLRRYRPTCWEEQLEVRCRSEMPLQHTHTHTQPLTIPL